MPGILRTRHGEGSGDREAGPRPWRTHMPQTRRGHRKVLNREAYGPISISEALFGPGSERSAGRWEQRQKWRNKLGNQKIYPAGKVRFNEGRIGRRLVDDQVQVPCWGSWQNIHELGPRESCGSGQGDDDVSGPLIAEAQGPPKVVDVQQVGSVANCQRGKRQ